MMNLWDSLDNWKDVRESLSVIRNILRLPATVSLPLVLARTQFTTWTS